MTTKITPPTTARNAIINVPTRTGRDISHHLASSRRSRTGGARLGPAIRLTSAAPEANDCTDSAGLASGAAILCATHDETVIIRHTVNCRVRLVIECVFAGQGQIETCRRVSEYR